MQFVQFNSKHNQRQRWQRFWPTSLLVLIAIIEILLTSVIIGLEFWICCCVKSLGCATYVLIVHIISIAASSILLYYDALFLRHPNTCLWPKNLCNEGSLHLKFFGTILGTSTDIHRIKFILIKIQITCATVMIAICLVYTGIYVYTTVKVYTNNKITDPHTTIELGRIQQPPPPYWPPPPPRELPPSSDF
ncbi:unnamed protein product [Rotaria sordida]|uniref:Uncharacterized protein n=1 Tax=Rotaria sordida TaxID=392033 RepID=A0A819XSK4_9BILA|nr:unnamed protein product [Rotaria sordida]CAF4054552.1 unnamed protein product [Rotaria sordida]CAF4146220.1 unnamed protein product [Rotaria sordida]